MLVVLAFEAVFTLASLTLSAGLGLTVGFGWATGLGLTVGFGWATGLALTAGGALRVGLTTGLALGASTYFLFVGEKLFVSLGGATFGTTGSGAGTTGGGS